MNDPQATKILEMLTELKEAGKPKIRPKPVSEVAVLYTADCKATKTPTTLMGELPLVRIWATHFGDRPIHEIETRDISDFLATKSIAAGTRSKYLGVLSQMIELAITNGWAVENPTKKIPRKRGRRRAIPDVDLTTQNKMIACLPEDLQHLASWMAQTGMRVGEVMRLKWTDINLTAGVVTVAKSKTGRPRTLALTAKAKDVLTEKAKIKDDSGRVFCDITLKPGDRLPRSTARRWFKAAQRGGCPTFTPYTLRHLFAVNLARSGRVDIGSLQAVMGHAEASTTLIYAAHVPQSAATRVGEVLDALNQSA